MFPILQVTLGQCLNPTIYMFLQSQCVFEPHCDLTMIGQILGGIMGLSWVSWTWADIDPNMLFCDLMVYKAK